MITNKTSVTSIMERKRFGMSHRKQQVRISHSGLLFSYRFIVAKVGKVQTSSPLRLLDVFSVFPQLSHVQKESDDRIPLAHYNILSTKLLGCI